MTPCEAKLLSAAADGDRRAWDTLVDRHLEATWRRARDSGLTNEDARQVVTSVWRNVALHLPSLVFESDLEAHLAAEVSVEARRIWVRSVLEDPGSTKARGMPRSA